MMSQRKVFLIDHHPGYISWEGYLENRKRVEANVAWSESKVAAQQNWVRLCHPACCVAIGADGGPFRIVCSVSHEQGRTSHAHAWIEFLIKDEAAGCVQSRPPVVGVL
jgi:hypothetical protein